MKKKRTWLKTIFLAMVRYERWKMNPRNVEIVIRNNASAFMFMMLLVIVTSCASVKTSTKENLKSDVKAETAVKSDIDEKKDLRVSSQSETATDKAVIATKTESNDQETTITDFDTDKPINPATGKPPVKRETKINSTHKTAETANLKETAKTFTKSDSILISRLKIKLDSMQRINSKLISNTEKKETTKSYWYWWLIGGMCIPVAVWLAWKFK